jgi:3-hydroxyisobutyrate dehydrogenase
MKDGEASKPRVAVLGLGTMGGGMAGRLLSAGFSTTVYNRNQKKTLIFSQRGATVAASPREAAAQAEIVISMVADDNASREIWFGNKGALAGATPGSLLIECSTLTVSWVKELANAAAEHSCDFLDAPVTGSKPQAAAGELLFLAGGTKTAVERAKGVFEVLGRGVVHLGPLGSGALLKLINNFLCGVQAASMAEALAWLEAAEIDRDKAVAVLGEGAPGSPIARRTAERAIKNDFEPAFSLRLMVKDLTYAVEEATRSGIELQTAVAALARFQQALRDGLGEQDFAAVTLPLRSQIGNPGKT